MAKRISDAPTYFCEDISSIEYRGGLFYLTDDCGGTVITRAMRPSTFFKCVANAAKLIDQFERENSEVAMLAHAGH